MKVTYFNVSRMNIDKQEEKKRSFTAIGLI